MNPIFKDRAIWETRTTMPTRLKISPKERPITPHVSRWELIKSKDGVYKLRKIYLFDNVSAQRMFMDEIFLREEQTQHYIDITSKFIELTNKFEVSLEIWTRGFNNVLSADKEFAAFCDIVYQDSIEQL